MNTTSKNSSNKPWLQLAFALVLAASFFLPWVSWDGSAVKGSAMASGDFFKIAETRFGLANPFPQFRFSFYIFWIIPLLAILSVVFVFLKKKIVPFSFIAGAMSLALITVFILFTNTLIDLGVGKNVSGMLKPNVYIHALSAVGFIITAFPVKSMLPKI